MVSQWIMISLMDQTHASWANTQKCACVCVCLSATDRMRLLYIRNLPVARCRKGTFETEIPVYTISKNVFILFRTHSRYEQSDTTDTIPNYATAHTPLCVCAVSYTHLDVYKRQTIIIELYVSKNKISQMW